MPPPPRAASPRRKTTTTNLGTVSEGQYAKLLKKCVDAAERSCEASKKRTASEQRRAETLVTLLREAQEKRPKPLGAQRSRSPRVTRGRTSRG